MRKQEELTDRKDVVKQTREQSEMMEKMGKKKKTDPGLQEHSVMQ